MLPPPIPPPTPPIPTPIFILPPIVPPRFIFIPPIAPILPCRPPPMVLYPPEAKAESAAADIGTWASWGCAEEVGVAVVERSEGRAAAAAFLALSLM